MSNFEIDATGNVEPPESGDPQDRKVTVTLKLTEQTSLVFVSTPGEMLDRQDDILQMLERADEYVLQVLEAIAAKAQAAEAQA